MQKKIYHKRNYISLGLVSQIRDYFDLINDSLQESGGPKNSARNATGWIGCWDRQLHYELPDNPIHSVISKLKEDFGDFVIHESSIRYLSSPFLPHSDIRNNDFLREGRGKGYTEGFTFLIPLWWKQSSSPGTVIYNSPANLNEPLYCDLLDILPNYSKEYQEESRNFSVKKILRWQSPGDLIAWENFQWHGSCEHGTPEYSRESWVKEFISIETWFKNNQDTIIG